MHPQSNRRNVIREKVNGQSDSPNRSTLGGVWSDSDLGSPPFVWVVMMLLLTLLLRVAWAIAVPFHPLSDGHAYFEFASNISSGLGYCWEAGKPTTFWAVGPSAIYAIAFRLLGAGAPAVVAVNCVAAAGTTWLGMILGARWCGARCGIITGVMLAIWPTSVMFTTVPNSEVMFCFLLLAGVAVLHTSRVATVATWAAAGPLFAILSLIRPIGLLIPLLIAASLAVRSGRAVRCAGLLAVCILTMLACIAPWTYRNYLVTGQFVLISTNGGTNTWMGNNPDTSGYYHKLPPSVDGMSEVERNRVLGREAREYIASDIPGFLKRSVRKFFAQHKSETIGVVWNEPALRSTFGDGVVMPLKITTTAFWLCTLALGSIGAIMMARQKGLIATIGHPLVLLTAYMSCVHAVTVIQDRYHLQWAPLLILLSAAVIDRAISFAQRLIRRD